MMSLARLTTQLINDEYSSLSDWSEESVSSSEDEHVDLCDGMGWASLPDDLLAEIATTRILQAELIACLMVQCTSIQPS